MSTPDGRGALIRVSQLWKSYLDKAVLERINLEVERNEFVTVVGASGCGKTTFLKLLLGEEKPTRRHDRSGRQAADAGAGQGSRRGLSALLRVSPPDRAGERVARAGTTSFQVPFPELRAPGAGTRWSSASAMLDRVGLLASAHAYPSALSGGMQTTAGAVRRPLITGPSILLLDEPFGAPRSGYSLRPCTNSCGSCTANSSSPC